MTPKMNFRPLYLLTTILAVSGSFTSNAADCVTAPANLVAWWRAEHNAIDTVNGNNGTLQPEAGFAAGMVGQAFTFNGATDSFVEVPDAPTLHATTAVTIEFWVKRTSLDFTEHGADYVLEKGGDWTGNQVNYGAALHTAAYNYCLHFTFAGGWRGGGSVPDTNWHHCAIVARNGDANPTLYVDGLQQPVMFGEGAPTITLYDSNRPLHIGAMLDPVTGWMYYGRELVDELSIYNRALTAGEIQAIYNAGSAGKCTQAPPGVCVAAPTNMISWWRGEDSTADAVGGNNGTIAGTGTVTYGPGVVGQAFVFDGTHRDRIDLGNPISLQLQDFTLEAWVKRSSPTITAFDILGADGSVCGDGACIIGWGRGGYILAVANDGRLILSRTDIDGVLSAPLITDLNWHHLAVTKAGSNAVFYVDGVAQATPAYVPHEPYTFDDATCSCNAAIAIGSRGDARGGTFYGMIDEPAVFSRALSAGEIQSIYTAGSAGMCPPACAPAPAGLVSWWRGEGDALDSWNRNKGELHGVTFSPGEVGQAFSFNGTSDYVHIPVAGNLPSAANLNVGLGAGLTLDAWVNPSDVGNGHPIIEWSRAVGGAPYGVHLWVGHPSRPPGYFYANIADTNGNWHVIDSAPGMIQSNVFQHVAVTYNRTNGLARLFLNGAIVTETNLGIFTPQTSYEVYFGERPPGDINSRFYAGLIDEIDIFNRALEPAEIQALYNAGNAGKCVVSRLPVANNFPAEMVPPGPLTIPATTFIAACSGSDGDTLSLDSVSTTSTNSGTVSMTANSVVYTPPPGFLGADSFSYTISNGNGGTASAYVLVQVDPSPFAAHMLPPTMVGGGFQLNFSGYPGGTYTLQRAESLSGPWIDLGTVTVDGSGSGTLVDPNPPPASAFYRAVYQ